MNDIGVIYCLTSPSGRRYVGQSWNFNSRISNYRKYKCSDQPKIYYALKKYGFDSFEVEILDYCFDQDQCMLQIINGKQKQHKGWTVTRKDRIISEVQQRE